MINFNSYAKQSIARQTFGSKQKQANINFTGNRVTTSENININGETIDGNVSSNTGIVMIENKSKVDGSVLGNAIFIADSQVTGPVSSINGAISIFNNSQITGSVSNEGGNIYIKNGSKVEKSICSKIGDIHLKDAEIGGDVTTDSGKVIAENAVINGTLTARENRIDLTKSTINNLYLKGNGSSGNTYIMGDVFSGNVIQGDNNVIISGNNIIRSGRGEAVISLGQDGSVSDVNGYTAYSINNETTVITPDKTVYTNGNKVCGKGPETYSEYQKAQKAPKISGPGWKDESNKKTQDISPINNESPKPSQIFTLKAGNTVKGNVTFESGNGKLIVEKGATFNGKVKGGILEKK